MQPFFVLKDIYNEMKEAVDSVAVATTFVAKHVIHFQDPRFGQTLLHVVLMNLVGLLLDIQKNGSLDNKTIQLIQQRKDVANYLLAQAGGGFIRNAEGMTAADVVIDAAPAPLTSDDNNELDEILATRILYNLKIDWTEEHAQAFERKGYTHTAEVVLILARADTYFTSCK